MLYVLNVHLFAVYIEIAKIPQICYTQSSSAHWGKFFMNLLVVIENLDLQIWKSYKELKR